MTEFLTTRQALDAYLIGSATLDDVSEAADRAIGAYFERTGHTPTEMLADRRETESPARDR